MNVALITLDEARCRDLVTAAVLEKQLPEVLSPWEVELLWDLNARALGKDLAATATADEWRIVEDCLASLRAALKGRTVVSAGLSIRLVEVA